jgi:hypothetical protein
MFSEKRKGDISEIQVCYHLMKKGYEVFRNISCVGFADVVIIHNKTKEKMFIDIKTPTVYTTKDGLKKMRVNKLSKKQVELGVKVACVYRGKLYIKNGDEGIEKEWKDGKINS